MPAVLSCAKAQYGKGFSAQRKAPGQAFAKIGQREASAPRFTDMTRTQVV